MAIHLVWDKILANCYYTTSRSSGSGGQHVNKTESRVTLFWHVEACPHISERIKAKILLKLANRINTGVFQISSEMSRSQHKNKADAQKRMRKLIEEALKEPKKRKPTRVPKRVKLKRLSNKKNRSETKENRRKPDIN